MLSPLATGRPADADEAEDNWRILIGRQPGSRRQETTNHCRPLQGTATLSPPRTRTIQSAGLSKGDLMTGLLFAVFCWFHPFFCVQRDLFVPHFVECAEGVAGQFGHNHTRRLHFTEPRYAKCNLAQT
ncbi:unnamed protein product [Protopolystoma xenopodis]|uniref:Uncharacterized protein n=1 Tax=Protopolystoma xenopodis TaxID=117903 RepID=A0A448X8B0_9PLAT|nr:unnamed protein product [Protopolystoma xenopodis]